MSSYTAPLEFEKLENRPGFFIIKRTFRFYIGAKDSPWFVEIEAGRITDLISFPKWLKWLRRFRPDGPGAKAACIHDKLYEERKVSRAVADYIFFHALRVKMKAGGEAFSLPKALLFWLAVRLGGGPGWFREWREHV